MILTTRQLLLNLILRTVPAGWTRPSANNSLEFILFSTNPDDTGAGGVEVTGGGYAPVAVTAADAAFSLTGDIVANVAAVAFPAVPFSAAVSVTGWGLRRTDGVLLAWQPLAGLPYVFVADDATNILTRATHGFVTDMPVLVRAIDSVVPVPTGLAAGPYFIVNSSTNTMKLAATLGGSAINIGSGVLTVRRYFGGTFNLNERMVIPAGAFQFQLQAPVY